MLTPLPHPRPRSRLHPHTRWSFEYFVLVRSMVLPTLALWEADYKCWEPGHTGKVGCSWDVGQGRFANEDYRAVRDWGFRFVLIALRWSTPVLVTLARPHPYPHSKL